MNVPHVAVSTSIFFVANSRRFVQNHDVNDYFHYEALCQRPDDPVEGASEAEQQRAGAKGLSQEELAIDDLLVDAEVTLGAVLRRRPTS